jgi:gluconolactonase
MSWLCLALLTCAQAPEPTGPLEKRHTGFVFTEGPASDGHGTLYFTDLRARPGRIYKVNPDGRLSLFVADSGRANGLAVSAGGEVIACQTRGRVVAYRPDGSCRVLADSYRGRRLNGPNDLVIDSHGGIYFTDPCYATVALLLPWRRPAVYYLAPCGHLVRLMDDVTAPNGIGLSPDEKTLYVVPLLERHVLAFPILSPGRLGPGTKLARIAPGRNPLFVGGDGMAVDEAGNLYVASARGVQIFDPDGRPLRVIDVPETPSNVAFAGPDNKTLVITARRSVYAIRMSIAGWEAGRKIR